MKIFKSAITFPIFGLDAAGEQDAGKIEVPLDLMERAFIHGDDLNRKSVGAVETAPAPSRRRDALSDLIGID